MSLNHPLATAGYVPYTPRQHRPQQRHALLRTAAQNIGLDSASLGFALLDRLVSEPGWTDIWQALALGRGTLLLPTSAHSDRSPISQELVKDHVAFVDVPANQLVTLSALRAVLYSDFKSLTGPALVFRSSSAFHVRHTLPPLPPLPLPDPQAYPTYVLLSPLNTQLSVPATAPNTLKPPPLPPRPAPAPTSGTSTPHRLPNPFASLFRSTTPPVPPPPAATSAPTLTETGDTPISMVTLSVLLIDRPILRSDVAKQVNTAIRAEISRRFGADADANHSYPHHDIPASLAPWVFTFVHEFALKVGLYPFTQRPHTRARTGGRDRDPARDLARRLEVAIAGTGRSSSRQEHREEEGIDGEEEEEEEYDVALWPNAGTEKERGAADFEGLVMSFQDFYAELGWEARSKIHQEQERGREQTTIHGPDATAGVTTTTSPDLTDATDSLIARIVESAESTLCSLFYDRLFMHPSSDDASHDATLSSRIAALNMVDITLDRLDMDVSAARDAGREEEMSEVVRDCGKALMRLESCRSPKDKAAVLVEAHKVVVGAFLPPSILYSRTWFETSFVLLCIDGLAKLPPIKLIPEGARGGGGSDGEEMKEVRRKATTAGDGGAEPEARPKSEQEGNSKSSPVSGDILLPFLIFSVVKSNPPHLVSHLLFAQRFRNTHLPSSVARGEESYCMINLMAVAEFLENVDLGALGVDVVLSPSHHAPDAEGLLSPILKSPGIQKPSATEVGDGGGGGGGGGGGPGLRDRMEQQVDAIGAIGVSANKVLAGVMDTSFGILKSLMTPGRQQGQAPRPGQVQNRRDQVQAPLPPSSSSAPGLTAAMPVQQQPQVVIKPGFGLLKRDHSGFSIASIASSLPIARVGSGSKLVGGGREEEMITVSRPGSIRSGSYPDPDPYAFGEEEGDEQGVYGRREESVEMQSGGEGGEGGEEGEEGGGEGEGEGEGEADDRRKASNLHGSVRSIKSFESMLSEGKAKSKEKGKVKGKAKERMGLTPRKSLSDRLAGIKVGSSPPVSRPSSLIFPSTSIAPAISERKEGGLITPPVQRFLDCAPDELRIGEVVELLGEYRRLVDAVRAMGGFARPEGDDHEYYTHER
ncbi:hypothetical protein APHAL10511_004160 [Amanita phalloides]|nr:hypothetical protein APHAL10511_004160 [Amanita phalloides]